METTLEQLRRRLAELDAETSEGVDDPIWLFERTSQVAKDAFAQLEHRDREIERLTKALKEYRERT